MLSANAHCTPPPCLHSSAPLLLFPQRTCNTSLKHWFQGWAAQSRRTRRRRALMAKSLASSSRRLLRRAFDEWRRVRSYGRRVARSLEVKQRCVRACLYVRMHLGVHVGERACLYVRVHVGVHVRVRVRVCARACVCACVCVRVRVRRWGLLWVQLHRPPILRIPHANASRSCTLAVTVTRVLRSAPGHRSTLALLCSPSPPPIGKPNARC